jgi:ankyrin repeat protein
MGEAPYPEIISVDEWIEAAGRGDTARLLIDLGADLHAVGHDGLTPLRWAVREGRTETAELLRDAGALR